MGKLVKPAVFLIVLLSLPACSAKRVFVKDCKMLPRDYANCELVGEAD